MREEKPAAESGLPALSHQLLAAVRRDESTGEFVERIADIDDEQLRKLSKDRGSATAFWLNCYNAFAQIRLTADPEAYEHKRRFFKTREFTVAGAERSLDDIEHGILRRSKWKYGLGYLPKPFPDAFERRHRLDDVDPRIHFALNCGAESCPPILAYTAENIDEELDQATESYLTQSVEYDVGVAQIPRLFLWFRGDFGGRSGIRAFLRRYDVLPEDATPRFRYESYDWSMNVGQWDETDG